MRHRRIYRARLAPTTAVVLVGGLLGCIAGLPAHAIAQDAAPATEADRTPDGAAVEEAPAGGDGVGQPADPADARQRALVLFDAAELRYQEARFEDAVALLLEARGLFDEPVISYNLGRAYEELERWAEAAAAFRHYLDGSDNPRDQAVVEARIERLERRAAETSGDGDGGGDSDGDGDGGGDGDGIGDGDGDGDGDGGGAGVSVGALVVTGLGAVGLVTGAIAGSLSLSARQEAVDDPFHASSRASFRDAENWATVANVSFVIGGVLAASGLTWLVLDLALGGEDEGLALVVGPGSLALRGELR